MMKKLFSWGLLPLVIVAILLGIACGLFFPAWLARVFLTFNGLFGQFLGFVVPLIILGLVAPGIAELGKGAGKLLLVSVVLAYGFTLFAGFFTYAGAAWIYPFLLDPTAALVAFETPKELTPYFTLPIAPLFDVTSALVLSFMLGLGMAFIEGKTLRNMMFDFRDIINQVISAVIIPLLPLYIFGIFMNMTMTGQVAAVLAVFAKIIVFIFMITLVFLFIQFAIAGAIGKKNPLKMMKTMLPAYFTALGTSSSAATIPVTYKQTCALGVRKEIAGFTIPLFANIHMSGSTIKITACAMSIVLLTGGELHIWQFAGFIAMLGVSIVAGPGVPGGAIMASLGVLQKVLGFDQAMLGLMIALYIAMDSFGTACNVTGDGALSVMMDRFYSKHK
ncbi:MAG: dicarboxylate/amino acid:cation symporter [Elusimicrobiaceae bacterium]|nr:dicarboxylate/amino acid:cation symporter [Elusimicrobiaceae bacterium]